MARLRDHERGPGADEARTLAEDHLQPPRIVAGGQITRLRRRVDAGEADDTAFHLRDCLVRDDDHVAVLERDGRGDQPRQVIALAHLGQPGDRNDPQLAQGSPVSRTPA